MSESFTIQKGIPVPQNKKGFRWPLNELKVGESFFIEEGLVSEATIRQYCSRWGGKNRPRKLTTRYMPEEKGYRVWRIK